MRYESTALATAERERDEARLECVSRHGADAYMAQRTRADAAENKLSAEQAAHAETRAALEDARAAALRDWKLWQLEQQETARLRAELDAANKHVEIVSQSRDETGASLLQTQRAWATHVIDDWKDLGPATVAGCADEELPAPVAALVRQYAGCTVGVCCLCKQRAPLRANPGSAVCAWGCAEKPGT